MKLRLTSRSLVHCLALALPSMVGCSLFAPSFGEYSSGQASAGTGGGLGGQGVSGNGAGGSSGSVAMGGASGGAGAEQGGSAGLAGSPSEGGWGGAIVLGRSVALAEVTLDPVVSTGLPTFAAFTSYDIAEATAAQPKHDTPIYKPYESTTAGWWDNLVAEQTQARVPVILFPSHGAFSLDPTDMTGPDPMNPRQLSAWVAAVDRAGSAGLFRTAAFIDPLSMQAVSNHLHGAASGSQMDLSVVSDWSDVFWLRGIKPFFDTIPKSYWLENDGHPVIELGVLLDTSFKNQSGNLSKLLSAVASAFHDAYNAYPAYVLDASWFSDEPDLSSNRYVLGQNGMLKEDSGGRAFATFAGVTFGTVLAGYADPGYYEQSGPRYHDASLLIPRKIKDSDGGQVITLVTGMAAAVQNQSYLTVLQDFTGVKYWDGFYRSSGADWETPNEYLNLVRRYSDPQTTTLKLEAEGCDKFSDTTTGNSANAYRRSGDLDVRALSDKTGWAVTSTAPGEWLEFDKVDFSAGTYRFMARHSTSGTSSIDRRVQLIIDDVPLKPIIAPPSANADTFVDTLLGEQLMTHGTHNIRVQFMDGLLDLDWLFVRKSDPSLAMKASNGMFLTALDGGGSTITAAAASATQNEHFTFDDLNGGDLVDGDAVNLQTSNGLYLSVDTTTAALSATQRKPGKSELFTVKNMSPGKIASGSSIALIAPDLLHYVSVGSNTTQLDATGTAAGAQQTFVIDGVVSTAPVK